MVNISLPGYRPDKGYPGKPDLDKYFLSDLFGNIIGVSDRQNVTIQPVLIGIEQLFECFVFHMVMFLIKHAGKNLVGLHKINLFFHPGILFTFEVIR
jgi:hypothetical protein